MSEFANDDQSQGWEIKRGEQRFRVKSTELLAKIYEEKRFAAGDQIRARPRGDWQSIETFDWQELRSPQKKPTESARLEPSTNLDPWWGESTTARGMKNSELPRKRSSTKLKIGLATGCFALVSILLTTNFIQLSTASKLSVASALPREQPIAKDASHLDEETPIGLDSTNRDSERLSVDEPKSTQLATDEVKTTPPMSDDVTDKVAEEDKEVPVESPPVQEMPDIDLSPDAKPALQLAAQVSASEERAKKTQLDRIYDSVSASLQAARQLQKSILDLRKEWVQSRRMIEKLKNDIETNRVSKAQAEQRQPELWLDMQNTKGRLLRQVPNTSEQEMLRAKLNALSGQWTLLAETIQKSDSNMNQFLRQLQSEEENLLTLVKGLDELFSKELHRSSDTYESIDLFGNLPLEIHERLWEESKNWILAEPDFFLAYLIESAAAIHLGKLETPEQNLKRMREQFQLLDAIEMESRRVALTRFEVTAMAICGIAKMKKDKLSDAETILRAAFQLKQPRVDLRFSAAAVAIGRNKSGDALLHIREGVRLAERSPKSYAIGLQLLLQNEDISNDIVADYLSELEKRIDATDLRAWPEHRFWMIASKAAHRIGDTKKAEEYLRLAVHECLDEEVKQLASAWSIANLDPQNQSP